MNFVIDYLPDFIPAIAPKMAQAGAAVMERAVSEDLSASLKTPHKSSLLRSIRKSHTFYRDNATRFKSNVYFEGTRPEDSAKRQGFIAAMHEYGAPKNTKRIPARFIARAKRRARQEVINTMRRVFDEETRVLKT